MTSHEVRRVSARRTPCSAAGFGTAGFGTAGFGTITTAGDPRVIQLALKVVF